MAFLHHVAAFTLVAVLAVELSLLRGEITPLQVRRLAMTDAVVGVSAGLASSKLIHLELLGVVLILLFAALMARGVGTFG